MAMDFRDVIYSHNPTTRVERGTFSRFVDVDGLGLRRILSFDREVTWLRESLARPVLRNGSGRIMDEGSANCDVGFLLQSFGYALRGAEAMALECGVGGSPFHVQVLVEVTDRPVLPLPRAEWDTDSSPGRWRAAPDDWFTADDHAALEAWHAIGPDRDPDKRPAMRRLVSTKVLEDHVAWDNRWDADRREAGLAALLSAGLAGLAPEVAERIAARLREETFEAEDA